MGSATKLAWTPCQKKDWAPHLMYRRATGTKRIGKCIGELHKSPSQQVPPRMQGELGWPRRLAVRNMNRSGDCAHTHAHARVCRLIHASRRSRGRMPKHPIEKTSHMTLKGVQHMRPDPARRSLAQCGAIRWPFPKMLRHTVACGAAYVMHKLDERNARPTQLPGERRNCTSIARSQRQRRASPLSSVYLACVCVCMSARVPIRDTCCRPNLRLKIRSRVT